MEQAEVYQVISLVCFGFGGLFLISAAVVFFHLRIIEVIGELTGRTAKKHIEAYRKGIAEVSPVLGIQEEETTDLTHMPDNPGEMNKNRTGETVLLINSMNDADEETSALWRDEEEADDATAVMEKNFQIVRDEISRSSEGGAGIFEEEVRS